MLHCLREAVNAKEISPAAAEELDLIYNRFVEQHALVHGDAEARRKAQAELVKRLEAGAVQRRRVALLQASAIERTANAVFDYRNARGEIDPARGLLELLETHGTRDEGIATGSLEGRRKAILGAAQSELEGLLETFTKSIGGARNNRARLDNVVRELFGQGTGDDAAKAFAKAWADTAEGLRQRYNESGGAIGKLEKWALPQMHDGNALRRIGFDAWSERISGLLDWDNMRHALSGTPILPDERPEVLRHVWDTITSEGWSNRLPSSQPQGRGALYKQHADHRFLIFKDADAWLGYQRDFGQGDPFAAMMGHLKLMSRDIAAMQMLGPNPDATLTWLKGQVTAEAQKARRGEAARFARGRSILGVEIANPVSRASYALHRADTMWAHYTGSADVAAGKAFAATMSTARNMTSAGALGSAVLSAMSDLGFGAMARNFAAGASIPGGLVGQLGTVVDGLRGMTSQEAVRAGLILDSAANTFGERAREAGLISGPIMSRFVADAVMRVQGLAAWTEAGKHGFGLWLMGQVGDQVAHAWDAMTPEVQQLFRRYGLGAGEWDIIRSARRHDLSPDGAGATILRPREIAALTVDDVAIMVGGNAELHGKARALLDELQGLDEAGFRAWRRAPGDARLWRDLFGIDYQLTLEESRALMQRIVDRNARDLSKLEGPSIPSDAADVKAARYFREIAERYHELVLQETAYAVPEPTLRSKAMTLGGARPGTIQGEAARAFGQFKSFGIAVALLHGGRVFNELAQGRKASGALYAGAGLATLTMLGMVSMQAKQQAKGEDFRDMSDPRNWGAAMIQAGGFGIYGDFFLTDQNRLGGGLTQTIVGPIPGRMADMMKATLGNVQQAADDKKTNAGRELLRNANAWNPLASLWFTRLAWDRLASNNLQRIVDPEAAAAFERQRQVARRDRGTGYWWQPGNNSPERLPEMGRTAGR